MENGSWAGVHAIQGETQIEFRAGAVVLADGGFQANAEMAGQYLTPAPLLLMQRNAGTGLGDGYAWRVRRVRRSHSA